jgi:hypothetical protein
LLGAMWGSGGVGEIGKGSGRQRERGGCGVGGETVAGVGGRWVELVAGGGGACVVWWVEEMDGEGDGQGLVGVSFCFCFCFSF